MPEPALPPDRLAPEPVDVALRDGSTVRVRAVGREDERAVHAFLEALSPASLTFRFFSAGTNLARAARAAAELDGSQGVGLVATAGSDEALVAHALFVATGPDEAEVAFEVADAWQGRGLGTILLTHLAAAAASAGITVFTAVVGRADRGHYPRPALRPADCVRRRRRHRRAPARRRRPLAPLDARDPGEMLRSLATFPLLDGYRGAPPADLAALEDLLARVSALAEHHPEVAELDANPVMATPDGCHVVDLRIRMAPVRPPPPLPSLQASVG